MDDLLDIRDVVRRTGLTSRALRFYEARGLVAPVRTHSGRRLYGAAALERINQIVALKRAGLTPRADPAADRAAAARSCAADRRPTGGAGARQAEIAEAKALLLSVKSRIDRGEPVDVATFCSLIRQGDAVMEHENWKKVADRYFTPGGAGPLGRADAGVPRASTRRLIAGNGRSFRRGSRRRCRSTRPARRRRPSRRMAGAAGAVQGGGDAGNDGRRRPTSTTAWTNGRASRSRLSRWRSGSSSRRRGKRGKAAGRLTRGGRGFGRPAPSQTRPVDPHRVAVIGRLARGWWWLTSQTLPAWAFLS